MTVTETFPPQFMRKVEVPEIPEVLLSAFAATHAVAPSLRSAAWKAFSHLGLPHPGGEEYSFLSVSDLNTLLSLNPDTGGKFQTPEQNQAVECYDLNAGKTPDSLLSVWINAISSENDAAAALATAMATHPLALRLKTANRLDKPIPIVCRTNGVRTDAALFFQLEKDSTAKVELHTHGSSAGFFNGSLVFHLGAGAELDFAHFDPSEGALTLKLHFILERGAKLRFLSASTGSRFQRLALEVDLMEPNAEADIRGAAVIGGSNRCHRHVLVRHRAPDCLSRQIFKTVALGAGLSSVDGAVVVDHDAQRTDARQVIHHLMLSKDSRADAKPRLRIHADDVKCSHGASMGRMNPEQLFYLHSRGLDTEAANQLLSHAFLAEALNACALTELRETTRARLLAALEERGL